MIKVRKYLDEYLYPLDESTIRDNGNGHYGVFGSWKYPMDWRGRIMSGREDFCKEMSIAWLKKHIQLRDDEVKLLMRKTGDHRKDCIIKKELFDREIKDKYYVEFAIDDRNQVCELWRSMGLTCLQCDQSS